MAGVVAKLGLGPWLCSSELARRNIHCLITRALGALNKVCRGSANGFCSAIGCNAKSGAVIMHKTFYLTFLATKMMVFRVMTSALYTDSSSYSISFLVPSPASLLVRLTIAKASWSSLDSRHLWCTRLTSLGIPYAPSPRTYLLISQ